MRNESRTIAVERELEQVTSQLGELREENKKLRELEQIKKSMKTPRIVRDQRSIYTQASCNKTIEMEMINNNNKYSRTGGKIKSPTKDKRNLHLEVNSVEKKGKNKGTRRKLSYPLENRKQEIELTEAIKKNSSQKKMNKKKDKDNTAGSSVHSSAVRRVVSDGKKVNVTPEVWSKVGR